MPRPLPGMPTARGAVVVDIVAGTGDDDAGDRLYEMGLTPGALVRIVRRGLFGDPLLIEVRGSRLSLRRSQAELILVREV